MEEKQPPQDLALAGLVHDLNNVFETISETADLLGGDARWAAAAAVLHRSVDRGRRLVDSYAGQSRAPLAVAEVVERAATFIGDFLTRVPAPQVTIHADIAAGVMVEGTAAEWERVFMNLFLNSVQAMPGGGRIEVRAREDAGAVHILVADNGSGIPAELIGDIFRPAVSGKLAHHGLGLHIVSSIVASLNGSVAASNRAAGGAEFAITVPTA